MSPKILFLLFFVLISANGYAQKEMNWWYFGANSGLNFGQMQPAPNGGGIMLPTPVIGPISTREGCFTLSDSQGNLLMSSDGRFVYNKQNQLMPNGSGLKGNNSATQSGIIIPAPGEINKYYIVTVAAREASGDGVNYYTVDLNQNGGLGRVVDTGTNLLSGVVCENIAAVRHKNKKDYWLIHRTGNSFYVWAITSTGFSSPMLYDAILDIRPIQPNRGDGLGELRFNSEGTRLVHVNSNYDQGQITMGEFNPATGIISNVKYGTEYKNLYGVEFSISGEYVYITQFDGALFRSTYTDFMNGNTTLTNLSTNVSNVKLGPDGVLYGIREGQSTLHAILNPEEGGTDIRSFPNYLLGSASLGLPTFATSWFYIEGETYFCVNTSKEFSVSLNNSSIAYTIWNFGDDSPVITDTDVSTNKQTHSHTYTSPGTYTITVRSFDSDDKLLQEDSFEVKVSPCVIPVNPNVHIR